MAFATTYTAPTLSESAPDIRAQFIRRTYTHLAGALLAFAALEAVLLQLPISYRFAEMVLSSGFAWLALLGGVMLVGVIARGFAARAESKTLQYAGLGLYVVGQAIIFVPILLLAQIQAGDNSLIYQAAAITGTLFVGLTGVVFITRTDFSFMRSILMVGGFVALGIIACGLLFGFSMGTWFSGAMILLAAGFILYDTSNVLHHYHPEQYVGASLELFASITLLLWYVLRLVMSSDD
ncbi:MAG: Bax inhibitor-1 family protein [Opitutales bacterium]